MGITINTARAHKWRADGEVTQLLTWINDERAMVLVPTYRKGGPWYVLMESAAYECLTPAGLARKAIKAAEVLGLDTAAPKIGGMIESWLDDLVTMPSAPEAELSRASYGQLTARADGHIIGGEEVRVPVAEGANYG